LADSFVHDNGNDAIAGLEQAFALLPRVEAIEKRLKPAIHDDTLQPVPQSLVLLKDWATKAAIKGLITPTEHETITSFARLADRAVQVDDFAQDFNAQSYRHTPAGDEQNVKVESSMDRPAEAQRAIAAQFR
jgi:acyl-CoA dehydrogenase